jgi:hypothetical protein
MKVTAPSRFTFNSLLPPSSLRCKVTAPSRFTFNSYYPRRVLRFESLIGHEGNSSIEIHFQQLLPPSPLFYCFTCLWLVFFRCRLSSAFQSQHLEPFSYRTSIWDISPPVRVAWWIYIVKVRFGDSVYFSLIHFDSFMWWRLRCGEFLCLQSIKRRHSSCLHKLCRWL